MFFLCFSKKPITKKKFIGKRFPFNDNQNKAKEKVNPQKVLHNTQQFNVEDQGGFRTDRTASTMIAIS